jgi:dolichol-phosphate mannosyltransferase
LDKKKYNNRIKLILLSRRFGFTPGVLAGFGCASGDFIFYLDADLQDPPALMPSILEYAVSNSFDVVHTKRSIRLGEPKLKLNLTYFAYKIINITSNINLVPNCGDFKLISRKVLNHILSSNEKDPYMRGLVVWAGFKQGFFEYIRQPRYSGVSHFPIFSLNPIEEFFRGVTSFSETPLYYIIGFGILVTIVSFSILFILIIYKIFGNPIPGWTFLSSLLLLFFGINFCFLGGLGVYIARIHRQVIDRPQFIIDTKYE